MIITRYTNEESGRSRARGFPLSGNGGGPSGVVVGKRNAGESRAHAAEVACARTAYSIHRRGGTAKGCAKPPRVARTSSM